MNAKSTQRNNNEITSPNSISTQLNETQKKGISDGHNRNVAGRSDNPSGIKPSDETPWNENEKARPEEKMYVDHPADKSQDEVTQTANKEEKDPE